jgi:hypothetical protein
MATIPNAAGKLLNVAQRNFGWNAKLHSRPFRGGTVSLLIARWSVLCKSFQFVAVSMGAQRSFRKPVFYEGSHMGAPTIFLDNLSTFVLEEGRLG